MIFSNKEVLELAGGKKYIVVDSLESQQKWYYYVCEVNKEETRVYSTFKIITTVTENGNLFVKTIKGDLKDALEMRFRKRLNLTK